MQEGKLRFTLRHGWLGEVYYVCATPRRAGKARVLRSASPKMNPAKKILGKICSPGLVNQSNRNAQFSNP
jgi:hypothetical protein